MEKVDRYLYYYGLYNVHNNSYNIYSYYSNIFPANDKDMLESTRNIYITKSLLSKAEVLVDLMEFINNYEKI